MHWLDLQEHVKKAAVAQPLPAGSVLKLCIEMQLEATGKIRWREGQLFPDGWEQMSIFEKAWQLYAGERGGLFWANKLAFTAIFVIIGGWVLFRIVGPATGLYQLTNDITTPTKY